MSALPPKADMCGATKDVRFGPKADIRQKSGLYPQDDLAEETLCTPVETRFARVLANHLFNNPPAEPLARRFLHFRTARLGPPEVQLSVRLVRPIHGNTTLGHR